MSSDKQANSPRDYSSIPPMPDQLRSWLQQMPLDGSITLEDLLNGVQQPHDHEISLLNPTDHYIPCSFGDMVPPIPPTSSDRRPHVVDLVEPEDEDVVILDEENLPEVLRKGKKKVEVERKEKGIRILEKNKEMIFEETDVSERKQLKRKRSSSTEAQIHSDNDSDENKTKAVESAGTQTCDSQLAVMPNPGLQIGLDTASPAIGMNYGFESGVPAMFTPYNVPVAHAELYNPYLSAAATNPSFGYPYVTPSGTLEYSTRTVHPGLYCLYLTPRLYNSGLSGSVNPGQRLIPSVNPTHPGVIYNPLVLPGLSAATNPGVYNPLLVSTPGLSTASSAAIQNQGTLAQCLCCGSHTNNQGEDKGPTD